MKNPVNQIVGSLVRFQRWLAKLPQWQKLNASSTIRIADTVTGCLDLLDYAPTTNKDAWIARRPERSLLFEPLAAPRTVSGRKAIRDLVALMISELEAARPFMPVMEVGVLPVKLGRQITTNELQALARGRETQRLQRKRLQRQRCQRLASVAAEPPPHCSYRLSKLG